MATVHLHWLENPTLEHLAAGHTAQMGHPSRPFDEPIHDGHLVKMLAPNHPPVHYDQKSGHYYTSIEEPDPYNPDGTRYYAMVWPAHTGRLMQAGYRFPDADEPMIASICRPTPEPEPAESAPAKGKKAPEG